VPPVVLADALAPITPGHRPVVLVVDDDPCMADLIAEMLDAGGFAVERAGTAAEARRKLGLSKPALVVLDLILTPRDRRADRGR
jgi:DNA-binding response OmpR family regulator